jgi:hypothetical protein
MQENDGKTKGANKKERKNSSKKKGKRKKKDGKTKGPNQGSLLTDAGHARRRRLQCQRGRRWWWSRLEAYGPIARARLDAAAATGYVTFRSGAAAVAAIAASLDSDGGIAIGSKKVMNDYGVDGNVPLADQLDFLNCNAPSAPFNSLSPRLVDAVLLSFPFGMEEKHSIFEIFHPWSKFSCMALWNTVLNPIKSSNPLKFLWNGLSFGGK